ncbi:MAG: hypothetical protein JWO73_961 [Candidatus Taylorbacteria bacterium]|nr:hypothetical protein [Candidatus Taylorbacteria bacterium]
MMHLSEKSQLKEGGYTLLFAVLITSIVLSAALSILSISRKEFLLSVSARESQFAFYAADSGLECAAYQDLAEDPAPFAGTSTGALVSFTCTATTTMITPSFNAYGGSTDKPATTTFAFSFPTGATGCASVIVQKDYSYGIYTDPVTGSTTPTTNVSTTIDSRGYNIGWKGSALDCSAPSPKKVERQLHLTH